MHNPPAAGLERGDQREVFVGWRRGESPGREVGARGHTQVGPVHVGMAHDVRMQTPEPFRGGGRVLTPVRCWPAKYPPVLTREVAG